MPKRNLRYEMAHLYERFSMDRAHAEHVADLCDRVFLELPHLHGLTKTCRRLVQMTALLHDIGEAGGKVDHAAGGARRLRRTRIPWIPSGWKPIIAQAVELHSTRSDVGAFLGRVTKERTAELALAGRVAAILRIGDGLDHCRQQDTGIAAIVDDGQDVEIHLTPSPHAAENARFAMRKIDLWNRLALRPIHRIEVTGGRAAALAVARPSQPVTETARRILQRQFEQFVSREYGINYRDDPEYIHEMRVAIRRIRSAIQAFRKYFGGVPKEWDKKVSGLAEHLGSVRDSDVLLGCLEDYAGQAPRSHRPVLRNIIDARKRRRQAEYRHLTAVFAGRAYRDIRSRFRQIIRPQAGPSAGRSGKKRLARPAWREARRSLRQYLERLLRHGPRLKRLSPRQQHRLRIDCKRLRYLAEFFQDFYGRQFQDMIETTVKLQDLLGTVHDSYVYTDWLQKEARRLGGKGDNAIQAMAEHLRQERRECLGRAGRIWRSLGSRRSRRRLFGVIKSPSRI